VDPPPSSSLAEEKRLRALLLRAAGARLPMFIASLRSARIAL
jgi:hypothetical protein